MAKNNVPPAVNEKLASLLNRILQPDTPDYLRSLLYLHLRENIDAHLMSETAGTYRMSLEDQAKDILQDLGEYIADLRYKIGRRP